jgi:hypothetical protein
MLAEQRELDRQRLALERPGLVVARLIVENAGDVVERLRHLEMPGTMDTSHDSQRLAVQRLR